MKDSYTFEGENFSVRVVNRLIRSVAQQFEVVERPPIVMALPVAQDGSWFLVKQHRIAIDQTIIEFPAGRVEKGEDPETAVKRELLEEIGFQVNNIKYVGNIITAPHFCDENIKIFFAIGTIIQNPQPTGKESSFEVVSTSSSELISLIKDGLLADAKSLAAVSLAMANGYITW